MTNNFRFVLAVSALVASAVALGQGSGPGANYYMADGGNIWSAFGNAATAANQASGNEYNIAVSGDIRTTQQRGSGPGNQYTLGKVATGTQYNGNWAGFFDGTSDGTNNYTLDFDSGNVFRFDRNWQNGTVLFNAGTAGQYLGITYDGAGGLWLSQWGAGQTVEHRTMSGTITGSFTSNQTSMTCLAMDYSTGTLWMGSQNSFGTFFQYSTSGAQLQSVFYSNMTSSNTLGGEFDYSAVPEPGTIAVLSLGLIALVRRKRTK